MRRVYDRFQPISVVDVHNQGLLRVPDDADLVESVAFSQRLALIMKGQSLRTPDSELTRYEGATSGDRAQRAGAWMRSRSAALYRPSWRLRRPDRYAISATRVMLHTVRRQLRDGGSRCSTCRERR